MNELDLLKIITDLKSSRDFYKSRCYQIQNLQSKMRDPERRIVNDILANGTLLYPNLAGDRYSINPETCPETCIYKRFSENMRNAAEHDKITAANEKERVCKKIMKTLDDDNFYTGKRWKYQEIIGSVRDEP